MFVAVDHEPRFILAMLCHSHERRQLPCTRKQGSLRETKQKELTDSKNNIEKKCELDGEF